MVCTAQPSCRTRCFLNIAGYCHCHLVQNCPARKGGIRVREKQELGSTCTQSGLACKLLISPGSANCGNPMTLSATLARQARANIVDNSGVNIKSFVQRDILGKTSLPSLTLFPLQPHVFSLSVLCMCVLSHNSPGRRTITEHTSAGLEVSVVKFWMEKMK